MQGGQRPLPCLDSWGRAPNILLMTQSLPAKIPSLTRAFDPQRSELRQLICADMSAPQIVSLARKALDDTGHRFASETDDPTLQRAGLWLLEMVKSGAGVLDRGTEAEIIWQEVPQPQTRKLAGRSLFYGAAGAFALAGFIQGQSLVIAGAAVLAALRFFDPKDWGHLKAKLPFVKKSPALEDQSGRKLLAQARITADAGGFVDSLTEAIKTADHILLRLAEPRTDTHWRDDSRLMGLVQGLLEARRADDGDFALSLIGKELASVLAGEGIEIVSYSPKTRDLFDILPALGQDGMREAAPALRVGDRVLRRGTVWQGE